VVDIPPAGKRVQPPDEIGIPCGVAAKQVPFFQQSGNVARKAPHPQTAAADEHLRQAGMDRQLRHLLSVRGEEASLVHSPQFEQRGSGLLEVGRGRCIDEPQVRSVR